MFQPDFFFIIDIKPGSHSLMLAVQDTKVKFLVKLL